MSGYGAVVLAGGAGRRLGGVAKPLTTVGGRPMLDRVLVAVADAVPRVVVGPPSLAVPPGVVRVSEEPPGGGPVAALAAGLSTVDDVGTVAVLAADLPFLTRDAMTKLRQAIGRSDGAVYLDGDGRRQTLCGVWRVPVLRGRLDEVGQHHGAALRQLLAGLNIVDVWSSAGSHPPWYDCDSPDDLKNAERWLTMSTLVDWVVAVRAELGLAEEIDTDLVLDVARDVAHGVARPAAPLTAYLLGLAVGRGADPRQAAATVAALAQSWKGSDD
jgi:molybdopterin-guanine dinucleotide biosynthesis protein A